MGLEYAQLTFVHMPAMKHDDRSSRQINDVGG